MAVHWGPGADCTCVHVVRLTINGPDRALWDDLLVTVCSHDLMNLEDLFVFASRDDDTKLLIGRSGLRIRLITKQRFEINTNFFASQFSQFH